MINKYFQFSGTISGTNYFLRNMLATFIAFGGGWLIGYGIGSETNFMLMIGLLVLVPAFWFNVCTIFKRSNALFPEQAVWITVGMIAFQVLGEVNQIFSIFPFVMGLILLFKNSTIEEHNG